MKPPKELDKRKFPLVFVIWKDAESSAEWEGSDKVKDWASKDCLVHEVGWLIYKNKKYIVITNQIGASSDFGNKTKIPVGWIISQFRIAVKGNGKCLKLRGSNLIQ